MRNLLSAGIRRFISGEPEVRPGPLQGRVIAVATSKGGAGKTTTAVHLAASLVMHHGWRVLLLDLDPQGHVAHALSNLLPSEEPPESFADLLLEGRRRQAMTLAVPTKLRGLDVLSGDRKLAEAESLIGTRIGKELLLRTALKLTRTHYHAVVIDCPPNLGNLTLNALLAADGVVIPLDLSLLSLQGVQDLIDTLETVEDRLGHALRIHGILRTRVDRRNSKVNGRINSILSDTYGPLLMNSLIGVSTSLIKAQIAGRPVYDVDPEGRGSLDYRAFVDELVERLADAPLG